MNPENFQDYVERRFREELQREQVAFLEREFTKQLASLKQTHAGEAAGGVMRQGGVG